MDVKAEYSSSVEAVRVLAESDRDLAETLERADARKAMYQQNWESVNINDVVARFAPNPVRILNRGKIEFRNQEGTISVVADIIGRYLRIQDLTANTHKDQFLTLDGKNGHNITVDGKTRGRSREEFLQATHFRIKKREET